MKQLYPALILILITSLSAVGQSSVGINTSTPNTKAVLELVSETNNQGFLVPRLSTADRQSMILGLTDRGMMVYDFTLQQFWYWNGTEWKAGLGVLDETTASGDLNGTFPEVYINDGAVGTDELTNIGTAGTYGDDSTVLVVTVDVDGRVNSVVERNVLVRSGNIVDASILNEDIANATIQITKLDPEGETDKVLAIDDFGVLYWEDQSAFTSSALPTNYLFIGNAAGVAQGLPASGDVTVSDAGTAVDIQLKADVVTTAEILDETIQSSDIMDLTVAEADIAAAAVTEQKIGADAVTAAKINPDVAGEALIPNATTGALDVNAGNGLLVAADSVEIDLQDIDGDGIVADLTDKELDVNVDDATLEVASDVVQVKDLGITNDKIAFATINAEAKISNINFNTTLPYLNRVLTINEGSEVEWTTLGNSRVLATNPSGEIFGKPLSDFATNNLPNGSIFVGDGAGNAQPFFASSANQILIGNGTQLSSVLLNHDAVIVNPSGRIEIQDNAVQGDDIDATLEPLAIAGILPISLTTTSADGQAIQLDASGGAIDIGGNQGVLIDANNNDIDIDAIAGSVNIDANQNITLTSNNVALNPASNANITTTAGDISLTSGDGISMTGSTGSSFTTSSGDIDINAAGQLDLDGGTTVAINGAGGVSIASAANNVDITADDNVNIAGTNAAVGVTAGTSVDINANAGNVTIDAAGGGSDVLVTAPDQIEFDATNTQVVNGTFELANGGIQVDEIVDETTVDLSAPSDNKLVAETALAQAIADQAGSGLTYDTPNQEIDLGGVLDQTADLVTAAGVNLQVSGLGILDVDTDVDILGDVTLSGAAQSITHTGATSLGVVSNTAPVTIDAQGNTLTIDGDQGVSVDAASNDIDVTAATGLVNVTGNQGVNVNATNNNLTLDAVAGTLVLDGNSGVDIDASTSGDVTINSAAGSVSLDGAEAAGDAVAITASDVSGGIDLTAGTGGIAAIATDGDVSLTTSTTGDVILDGADDVTLTGGTNVTTTATAGTATLTATAGEVDLTAGTTVDINASGGNVTIDAVGAGNDILVTAPDQIEFNATNTQIVGGTFELENGGIQVDEIVDDLTVDLAAPSDNKLITETALATAIGNQAGSGLTYDGANQEIDLGGTLDQTADLVTAAGVNLQVSGLGILDVDTDVDILGDVTLSGATQSITHTGATSLGVVSNTAPVTIDAQGNTLTIDGDQGVSVDAASNDIDVTAATGLVNVTGNQGVNVNATNNNLTLDAVAGTLVLDGNSGVDIDASTSGDVTINSSAGSVSIDGAEAAGDAVAITASDVSGGIDLTAGTGGIAAIATDGDVSLTTSTTGDVILDGADDVTLTGGTNVTTTATAGTATLTATAGEVDITAGTTVDINASGGNVTIDAVGAGNDILVTAPDQIEFNATNTQIVGGTFELENGGIQVDEIVDDLTVDLAAPSDNKLITETALATAIGNQAGSGLTYDGANQEIDLGGTLDQTADLVTAAGVNLQVSGLGILDVDTDVDILGDVTLSGATQSITHTGATSLGVVSNTAPVTIDAQGNTLTLDGDQGVSVDAASNDIDVTAATGLVNVTGNQGVNVNATNNNLTLDAVAGTLELDGNSGVDIDASTSGDVTINSAAGSVSLDGAEAAGDAVAITASDVSGGIDLTAGTGGIAAIATDGDVSLTTSTTGDVILDGADDVTITGGTNVTTTATAGTATLTATAGEVDLTAGTTVDINAAGGNVTIDAAGAGNDIVVTAPDQVQFNGTNTQIVSGTFELANGGIQVDEIVDDLTVDLATPSDNKLVTETALATAIGNQAGSGLTYDGASQEIDLGGTLDQTADLVTAAGVNLQVSGVGILDVDTDVDILGDVTLSGAAQSISHTGATSLGVVSNTAPVTIDAQANTLTLDGDQGVSVDAASNDIDVTAATGLVNVTGNQGVNVNATNNNLTLDAVAGTLVLDGDQGVNIDASTAGDVTINSAAGSVSLDGAEAVSDAVSITASDVAGGIEMVAGTGDIDLTTTGEVTLNGTNTQVETGSFELNSGTTVTNIQASSGGGGTGVRADGVADDNTLVTESAVREALINSVSADNGLTEGPTEGNIQLGGALTQNTTITQDGTETLTIANTGSGATTISLTSTGDFVVDGQTGDVTIDQDGAMIAGNGVAVTGGNVDVTNDLDVDGATTLDQTTISTDGGVFAVSGTNGAIINTTSDAAGAITLGTNGGTSETIAITNTQGTSANAIDIDATAGGVDIDGGTTVAIDGATGLSIGTAANDIDINAAGQLDLDGGTTVAIDGATGVTVNSTANDVDITGAANTNIGATTGDVDLTAAGEVTLNGTNTQVETGSFELNSGTTVTNIQASTGGGGSGVRADGVADDNTLVTESAVREAISNFDVDNGLTNNSGTVQLGGDLIQNTTITQDGTETLTIANTGSGATTISLTSTGDFVVDGQTGDVTIDQDGAMTAGNGVAVTGGNVDVTNDLDVDGATTLDQTTISTDGGVFAVSGTNGASINTTSDAAGAITLGTNGGTSETIAITNTQGTSANAIDIDATAGGVDIDGGTTVAIDGATGLSIGTAANDIDINAAGQLDLDGGTTVAIDGATGVTVNSTANDVDITGAANTNIGATTGDVDLTAAGEVTLNGTNTQVETGSFELNSGTTVTNIQASTGGGGSGVRADGVADDNTLVTESAVREAISNFDVDNGLTNNSGTVQLGGDLIQNTTITQDGTETLTIANTGSGATTISLTSTGDFVVDGQTGDVTIDQDGAMTAGNGVAVTGGNVDVTNDLDVDGATTLDQTTISTDGGVFAVSGTNGASINTTSDAAGAITLGTNGGTSETIAITNTQGTSANAIDIDATAGGVDIDGGTTVAIDGATGLSIGTAANDIDINAAGQLDLDGGTTVAIDGATGVTVNSTANDVDITGAANTNIGATTGDVDLTAAGEVTLNGTNTQVETGSFELNSGTTVTNIQASTGGGGSGVRADGVADDNTLVTESAVREAIDAEDLTAGEGTSVGGDGTSINIGGGNAFTGSRTIDVDASNLTIDATGGGSFIVDNNAGGNFQVTGSGGNVTVDNTGNLDAANGLDVTTSDLTVGGTNFIVDNTGNVTAEGDTDLNGDLTVDGGTFSLDATGASNVTTSTGGLTVEGADGVNITSTTSVGVIIDANTAGTIDVDGIDGVTIDASGGAIGIGTNADNQAINLGTAGDRTITLGTTGGTTGLILDAGSGGIDLTGATNINGGSLTIAAGADATFNDNVTVANGTTTSINSSTIGIGNAAADAVTIGGTIQGATPLTFNAGNDNTTFAINANSGSNRTITFPDADGTVVLDGDINLNAAYQGGNTITATAADGDLTVNLSQTSDFVIQDAGTPFITATNSGELDIDNLRIDGNTISSTDVNGNILLVPNGTGVVQTSAIDINGGSITGITDLAVADGGTGASDAATARTNLGIDIGSDIQAWDQALDDISGLAVTDGNIIVADGTNWIAETGATARTSLGLTIGTDVQAYDAGLNSIAGLTTAADQMVYTTGSDTYAVTNLTAAGRAILDDANAAAQRTTLGIDIGSDIQAWDQALDDISGLAVTDGNIIVADGTNWIVETGATARTSLGLTIGTDVQAYDADLTTYAGITPSADIQSLLGSADYSTARTNLGLAIGSDVQAYDAGLNSIAGLTTAADQMVYTTGSDTYAVTNLTAAGRAILDDANAAAQRTTLGIDIGSDIQAWDQALDDISGLAVTDGNIIVADGTNWIAETGATARTSLGLTIGTDVQAYDADLTTYAGITPSADIQSLLGSADYSTARTNLGLAIGSDVQAYDAGLNSIAGLTTAADQMVYTTGSDTYAVTNLTAAGRAILDDANAAAQRTTLGLGSISTLNTIGSSEVTDNSLTSDDLGTGSVNTDELADDAVTTAKLGTAGAGDANKTYTTDASGNPQLTSAVGFEVYLGSIQTVTGLELVEFDTEVFDVNGNFDNSASNHSFTAPVDGLYHFEIQIEADFNNGGGEVLSYSLIVDDGTPTEVIRASGIGTTSITSWSTSKTIQLSAGDVVYVEFNNPPGSRG